MLDTSSTVDLRTIVFVERQGNFTALKLKSVLKDFCERELLFVISVETPGSVLSDPDGIPFDTLSVEVLYRSFVDGIVRRANFGFRLITFLESKGYRVWYVEMKIPMSLIASKSPPIAEVISASSVPK